MRNTLEMLTQFSDRLSGQGADPEIAWALSQCIEAQRLRATFESFAADLSDGLDEDVVLPRLKRELRELLREQYRPQEIAQFAAEPSDVVADIFGKKDANGEDADALMTYFYRAMQRGVSTRTAVARLVGMTLPWLSPDVSESFAADEAIDAIPAADQLGPPAEPVDQASAEQAGIIAAGIRADAPTPAIRRDQMRARMAAAELIDCIPSKHELSPQPSSSNFSPD